MNRTSDVYVDLNGERISLANLDSEERKTVERLIGQAERAKESSEYRNAWMAQVTALYTARGLSRRQMTETPVWRIAQDLGSRLGVKEGWMHPPDYRDELQELIRENYPTQRAFCQATGISEDLLSHVLARRKHLAIDTLTEALERIGYRIHIVPAADAKS